MLNYSRFRGFDVRFCTLALTDKFVNNRENKQTPRAIQSLSMPSYKYKVHPASIPKHLRIPRPPTTPAATLKPSSLTPSFAPSTLSTPTSFSSTPGSDAADIWFSLPRFRVGLPQFRARRAAEHHPVAKLRDPISLRVYDFIVRASVPALLVYFVWWAPGGEQSDIAVVSGI